MRDTDQLRASMVRDQLQRRGIKDLRVLAAMGKVERHLFVPDSERDSAYEDFPLPIGEGQTISQPYIVALMSELLDLRGREKVLEIGTGSGYQTAVLAELAREVFTVERVGPLAARAERSLAALGYGNISFRCDDGFAGWPEQAPFDAVMVTCAPDDIPERLGEQLAEGGRMVVPVGREWQELKLARKEKGRLSVEPIAAVRFVPMVKGPGG